MKAKTKLKKIADKFAMKTLIVAIGVFALISVATATGVLKGNQVIESATNVYYTSAEDVVSGDMLGAINQGKPIAIAYNFKQGFWVNDTQMVDSSGNLTIPGTTAITGNTTIGGTLNFEESYENATATDTIAIAESGKTIYMSGASQAYTLPATSTSAGAVYRFVVGGDLSGDATIVTSAGGDYIEGALIVAGAVVDCDAEDTITFVSDGENLGDYVELRSNGTNWFIGASGGLTSGKITCSTT